MPHLPQANSNLPTRFQYAIEAVQPSALPLAQPATHVYITPPGSVIEHDQPRIGRMRPLLEFIAYVVSLYEIVVIAAVIFSWLIAFNVVNASNPFVRSLWQAISAVTEVFLKPIRRFMPAMGGLDLSPIILLIAIYFLRFVVINGWLIPAFR